MGAQTRVHFNDSSGKQEYNQCVRRVAAKQWITVFPMPAT